MHLPGYTISLRWVSCSISFDLLRVSSIFSISPIFFDQCRWNAVFFLFGVLFYENRALHVVLHANQKFHPFRQQMILRPRVLLFRAQLDIRLVHPQSGRSNAPTEWELAFCRVAVCFGFGYKKTQNPKKTLQNTGESVDFFFLGQFLVKKILEFLVFFVPVIRFK